MIRSEQIFWLLLSSSLVKATLLDFFLGTIALTICVAPWYPFIHKHSPVSWIICEKCSRIKHTPFSISLFQCKLVQSNISLKKLQIWNWYRVMTCAIYCHSILKHTYFHLVAIQFVFPTEIPHPLLHVTRRPISLLECNISRITRAWMVWKFQIVCNKLLHTIRFPISSTNVSYAVL